VVSARRKTCGSIRSRSTSSRSLRVGSTNLDKHVRVSHSFIIQVLEIDLPPRTGGDTGSSDFIPDFLLDLRVLGELEEGERQRVGTGLI